MKARPGRYDCEIRIRADLCGYIFRRVYQQEFVERREIVPFPAVVVQIKERSLFCGLDVLVIVLAEKLSFGSSGEIDPGDGIERGVDLIFDHETEKSACLLISEIH